MSHARRQGRSLSTTLRQPTPTEERIAKDQAPSWWVGLDHESLNREAKSRAVAMSSTKEARTVQYRTLQ